ncbi:MAG TPA: glucose 1-dehydrogenase [Acidimicrobiales bacterium]|nr:glucose 1-dehydrogenase [Acidimicrobiales bacterium]
MRALTLAPGVAGSAHLDIVPDPQPGEEELLVEGLAVGVCGTDREIVDGSYGLAPAGRDRLVLGHESLGSVLHAPAGSGLSAGELVVGMVRRPDPVPCPACAVGQWDMCRNGLYVEHGIKELDGFAAERYTLEVDAAVVVPAPLGERSVLVEPASVVAKAWEHIERIGGRAAWSPRRVLVTGAGPIGLLAALFAVQRGYEVHVLDVVTKGPKPALVSALGATYHSGAAMEACAGADIVVECTGVPQVVIDVMSCTGPAGVVCLTGVSSGGRRLTVDAGALNRELVLENDVVFGTVNANAAHYRAAVEALSAADPGWLDGLISRRVPLSDWSAALERRDDDVKVVIDLTR